MLDLIERNSETASSVETAAAAGFEAEAETRRNIGRFGRAMWVVVALLLLFNSGQLVTVVNGFGVGPVQDTVVAMATTWNAQMEKRGLTRPAEIVRDFVNRMRDTTWEDVQSSTQSDAPRQGASLRGPLDAFGS